MTTTQKFMQETELTADNCMKGAFWSDALKSSGWQPIETAPKHKILLLFAVSGTEPPNWKMATGDLGADGIWTWDGQRLGKEYHLKPTHWMSLPEPPKTE